MTVWDVSETRADVGEAIGGANRKGVEDVNLLENMASKWRNHTPTGTVVSTGRIPER